MASEANHVSYKKSGSRILWQITVLVLAVFIISAGLSWSFYWGSTDELIEDAKEDLVETQAQNMSSTFGFITDILSDIFTQRFMLTPEGQAAVLKDLATHEVSQIQIDISDMMLDMIEAGTLGMEEAFVVLPGPSPVSKDDIVIMGSNQERIYADVPESILPIFENDESQLFLENGIPEWGLNDEYLFVCKPTVFGTTGQKIFTTATKSMHEEIESINSSYQKKQRRVNIIMGIVISSSVLVLFIITFFVLRHLISSRITKPIDQLSEVAEQVMEGDLDVEIEISKGEEFEGLKRAFSKMLESLRDIMARAAGGE